MTTPQNQTRRVTEHFAECELEDEKPSLFWVPTQAQIARWGQQIQLEAFQKRLDEDEAADDYEAHSEATR